MSFPTRPVSTRRPDLRKLPVDCLMISKRGSQVGRGRPLRFATVLRIAIGFCALGALLPLRIEGRSAQGSSPPESAPDEQIVRFVKSLDTETLLGQTLMVGVQAGEVWPKANENLREVIAKYRIGGVILSKDNLPRQYQVTEEETVRRVADLTRSLQKAAFAAQLGKTKIPLLIAMDQEGGSNMTVAKGTTRIPNHVFLGGTRSQALTERAGFVIGSELHALGVNVALAPVTDINNNADSDIIGKRAFGAHQKIVAPLSVAFAQGLKRAGVLAVAKHFPGHGSSAGDPHYVLPDLGYSDLSQLEGNDLMPFRELISSGVDGIMTAHILATPLDDEYPITISEKGIQGLLRQKMGFQGVIFTDDLASMKGILIDERGKPVRTHLEASRRALEVGSDILVFGQLWLNESPEDEGQSLTLKEFGPIYVGLKQFAQENRHLLEQAVVRILRAKARLIPWQDFGDLAAWQVDLDRQAYDTLLKKNAKVAEDVVRESAILISEDGYIVNDVQRTKYFRAGRGPLSKGVMLNAGDRLTLVSPVFDLPDELLDMVHHGWPWLPKDQIESVHMVYGWRNAEAMQKARDLWKEEEKVEKLAIKKRDGKLEFQWEAIDRKAEEILRRSKGSRVILFGVLLREHLEVLRKVCARLPSDGNQEIVVLLFLEPYFVPRDLYQHRKIVFLYISQFPDMKLAEKFLLGEWLPKPVSHLSVSIPPLINRGTDPGEPVALQSPPPSRSTPPIDLPKGPVAPIKPPRPPGPSRVPVLAALSSVVLLSLLAFWFWWRRRKRQASPLSEVPSPEPAAEPPGVPLRLPKAAENNFWYRYTDAEAVIVFVHGILSDSRSCWLWEDPQRRKLPQYWPAMIQDDPRFGDVGIYLGGYYTDVDAKSYEIADCAREIFSALSRKPERSPETPVLDRQRIVFVCHSTGGIVVRYLLERYVEAFESKEVGLVLIASPSYGSRYADRLKLLSRFYKHQLGRQLRWGNWSLRDLDERFKDLVDADRIPGLRGVEAVENHFIFHRKWLPNQKLVVAEESAGRYFGAPVLLRKTDHFSTVKPDSRRHPAYELLVDFWIPAPP